MPKNKPDDTDKTQAATETRSSLFVGSTEKAFQVLHAFDGQDDMDLESAAQRASQACTSPEGASSGSAASHARIASAASPCG